MKPEAQEKTTEHIASIAFDEASITTRKPQLEHERIVAINDITQWNHFAVKDATGPYDVLLSAAENRVTLTVRSVSLEKPLALAIPLQSLKTVIRDYFLICDSYYKAIRTAPPSQIESLDMGRRALHDEGATLLRTRLTGKIETDFDTARRLFTLICVLHLKG